MDINLVKHKKNIYSQNGEDGVIEALLEMLGNQFGNRCCEFGAWDGIHFSNTKHLIDQGWSAIMIEADKSKFVQLQQTYKDNTRVLNLCEYIDDDKKRLSIILNKYNQGEFANNIDLLSLDIDGEDYQLLSGLDLSPKIICIEVNAGHSPKDSPLVPRAIARKNVGQSLGNFTKLAISKGYQLVCYTGNAFYVRNDILSVAGLKGISAEVAYQQFLETLTTAEKEWIYMVNMALVTPYHHYHNPYLSSSVLLISFTRAMILILTHLWSATKSIVSVH